VLSHDKLAFATVDGITAFTGVSLITAFVEEKFASDLYIPISEFPVTP
jgi:hypothetical protein